MFDISFQELLLIGVIALVIMGPERLPGAVRTATLWISRLRRSFQQVKDEIAREIDTDDIKQQLHNESIMQSLTEAKNNLDEQLQKTTATLKPDPDKLPYDISDIVKSDATESHSPTSSDDTDTKTESPATSKANNKTATSD